MLIDGISGNIWQQAAPPPPALTSILVRGFAPSVFITTIRLGEKVLNWTTTAFRKFSDKLANVTTACRFVPFAPRRHSSLASQGAPQQPGQLPGLVYAAVAIVCTLDTG